MSHYRKKKRKRRFLFWKPKPAISAARKELVASLRDIVWEIDRFGTFTYISEAVEPILGYRPAELIGRSLYTLMRDGDRSQNLDLLENLKGNTVVDGRITHHMHKLGYQVILEISGAAFKDDHGTLSGFRAISRDVSSRYAAEQELLKSERRFRSFVETASDWLWETDAQGRFTYSSPQVREILGYAPHTLIGRKPTDLMPPQEARRVGPIFRKAMRKGDLIDNEVNVNRHLTGRDVFLETNAVPFMDHTGALTGYRGINRDITDRKLIEKKLQFERNLFRTFMNQAPDLIYFKDLRGRFIEVNAAKAAEQRITPQRMVGKTDFDFLPAEQARRRQEEEEEAMRTGEALRNEECITTPHGKRWYLSTKVPHFNEEGDMVGTFGTSWDITSLKHAEEEMQRLRTLLGNIIDSMPSILIGVNSDGRVTQWNKEAVRATGIPATEAQGQPLSSVFPLLAGETEKVKKAIMLRKPQKETRIPTVEEGITRYHDITVYPLLDNQAESAVIRVDDVSERIRMEEMIMQSEKMLSIGGLAAGMAHEINNPLAGILQNLQVMRNRIVQDSERNLTTAEECGTSLEAIQDYMNARGLLRMMDTITESGRRAAKIVDNMLSFSRKGESYFTPHNLANLIVTSVELASNDYNLKKRFDFRHIDVIFDFEETVPDVPCESSQIQQVLLNLLTNSAQAFPQRNPLRTDPPTITIRLKKAKSNAVIEIEDNGPGMPPEIRKRIFEPFFTTKDVGAGTGLGLSVSYFIITENHGGTMSVDSTEGKGSTFSVKLPYEHHQAPQGLRL
jgi:PAS domain S-box-containing protein